MSFSVSTDFILGVVVGMIMILLFQQMTKAASGVGRWMPVVLMVLVVAGAVFLVARGGV